MNKPSSSDSFDPVQHRFGESLKQTRHWIESVVINLNFCPFAGREFFRNSIRYRVVDETETEACLLALIEECVQLDQDPAITTTLLIYPQGFAEFTDFLTLNDIADDLLAEQAYEGIYQLASFHPDYQFADSEFDDASNYTNRSPYPMLHILREELVEKAVQAHTDPEQIPQRNIELARGLGREKLALLLKQCY